MSIGATVVVAFRTNNVDYSAVSIREPYNDGESYLQEHYKMAVCFLLCSEMYIRACQYVMKNNKEMTFVRNVLQKHPNLEIIS